MGRQPITAADQHRALVRAIVNSEPVLNITPGMWQHLETLRRRRPRSTERAGCWLALAGDVLAVGALVVGLPLAVWAGVGLHVVGWLLCGNFVARNLLGR